MAYREKSVCHNYDILSERLQLCGGSLQNLLLCTVIKISVVCETETKILSDKKICCISDISQYTDYTFYPAHGFFSKSKNKQQNSADEENYTVNNRL